MISKEKILEELKIFSLESGGIGSWITPQTDEYVLNALSELDNNPLSYAQFNQLLVRGHQAPCTEGFFKYYWCSEPQMHPYEVSKVAHYDAEWASREVVQNLDNLKWGLLRLFMDGLLWWGNIREAYRELRSYSFEGLEGLFREKRYDTELLEKRGPTFPMTSIAKDDRYLISEMACKSYGDDLGAESDLRKALRDTYQSISKDENTKIKIADLLNSKEFSKDYSDRQKEFEFSADDVLGESIASIEELDTKIDSLSQKFNAARRKALENTKKYLSMVGDLDVYVATSMRTRSDFRHMADITEDIFSDSRLTKINIRYFDPTLSAAAGHEDKGLIECLMVKCAKVLVYCAGEKDSYGKDAEAAMALSLGKPVIFLCDEEQRTRFYRDVHPLSRLIDFSTGVPVGAMVTSNRKHVADLLYRIFSNTMKYTLRRGEQGRVSLCEDLTQSIVRLETGDRLLSETFWNHYHGANGTVR